MKIVIQRVTSAAVAINNKEIARIRQGLLVLVGIGPDDTSKDTEYCVQKILKLRIFNDEYEKMNKSIVDVGGDLLLVSQFTLYADVSKGNRPSFTQAMPPEQAKSFFEQFVMYVHHLYPNVQTGIFGAYMQVNLINDGPVTIILDSRSK
jgi:D-aminoacyl-tRNA deacylase